ncbi:MAG TPA: VacB/RNase II family 3'-5' exoribonuclease, partial [Cellvibrionaceae bacterium]
DPDQMQRVLPGDRVKITIEQNSKKQLEAHLEALLDQGFKRFVGRYVRKGPAHFVEPDLPPFNRWLFIPPQERTNCTEGDFVECELVRHPFKHEGKAQVRVVNRIGRPDESGIEGRYIAAKFGLPNQWDQASLTQAQQIAAAGPLLDPDRRDMTDIEFVTIDSEFTRDMDDAIYTEQTAEGWKLVTAIADPGAHISINSPLDISARERASTLYLLGYPITMLPPELSHDTYSLVPEQDRPALVCEMHIASDGHLTNFQFSEAMIRSRYKLSYNAVSQLLENSDNDNSVNEITPATQKALTALQQCAEARLAHRQNSALVMEDRPDYQYWLNEQKKIERIEKRGRNIAQKMVEEAMLATNICAGQLFAEHPGSGIFSTHIGFRPERIDDAKQLINEVLPDYNIGELATLADFQALFKDLRQRAGSNAEIAELLSLLQRMQQAGSLRTEALGHFGLGFAHYAMVTSPIRRYQDLYNHYALKAILRKQPKPANADTLVDALQEQQVTGRQASRQLEQWLLCQYLTHHIGTVHTGRVTAVTAKGVSVKLDDIGTDGFVVLAEKGSTKPKFDSRKLTLITETDRFYLDQPLTVQIKDVDVQARRIGLSLVDDAIAERLSAFNNLDDTP